MDGCAGGCPEGTRKEVHRLKKVITELLDITASLKKRNAELDEKRKAARKDYYETATELEDAKGLIVKLTAQVNHDYENSSLPSSKCINRKKITNNREKSGKKPGAQAGHPHHPRKAMKPDKVVEIQTEERLKKIQDMSLQEIPSPDRWSASVPFRW